MLCSRNPINCIVPPHVLKVLRLAATCSLISLMIGYSPGLFNSLMGRLEKWAQQGVASGGGGAPAPSENEVKG